MRYRKDVTAEVLKDPEAFIGQTLDFTYDDPNNDDPNNENFGAISGGSGLIIGVRHIDGSKRNVVMESDYGYGFPLRPHLQPRRAGLKVVKLRSIASIATAEEMLEWVLERIASLSSSRWDQHLRHEFGDEGADSVVVWLEAKGVKPYRGR